MSTPSNRASNPAGKSPRKKDVTLDLTTARQMLPLVRGIVTDIVDTHKLLARLAPEQEMLEEVRRNLDWAGRQRRYAVGDEIARAEKNLGTAVSELNALGLKLIDPQTGSVDFPTRINGRAAAFTWQPGDESVGFWHYSGEDHRRPIPSDWQSGAPIRYRSEP
jgi:hypothetical protein